MAKFTYTITAVAAATMALVSAGTAFADPGDDAFLNALNRQRIAYPSATYAISTAHTVCDVLDNGATPDFVATGLSKNSGLGLDQTTYIVNASISAYCPKHQ